LKKLSFLNFVGIFCALWSVDINGLISELSILFHWSTSYFYASPVLSWLL
jgi:hypothetical protein